MNKSLISVTRRNSAQFFERKNIMLKKNFIPLLLIVALAAGLTACGPVESEIPADDSANQTIHSPSAVIAEGTILPVRAEYLAFLASGFVEEISVELGDTVEAGQVLARLSSADQVEAQLAAAELELLSARQALDTLVRNGDANLAAAWIAFMGAQEARAEAERDWERLNLDNIEDRIEDALVDILDAEEELQEAQDEMDKYADLDEDNSSRERAENDLEREQEDYNEAVRDLEELERERDTVRAALDAALAAEAEARHQLELSAGGANADDLALAEARLASAQAQAAAVEDLLTNYLITVPFDGVVTDVNIDLGEQTGPGIWAISVADLSEWVIESTDVTELEIVRVFVGQEVTFTADAFQEVSMTGVVSEIGQSPVVKSGDVTYVVRIAVDQADLDPRVMWGMTVELVFEPED
jgi:multidrug efflux pump subunit AcrA (membrane-fusion protein)